MRALRIWAEMFEDAQKARIACENRAKRGGVDGESYEPQLHTLQVAEREIGKAMRKCYRRDAPPGVVEWQKNTIGIGEHLLARLLGVVGHPCFAQPHHWEKRGDERVLVADEPFMRTVGQLWSYCGHGDPRRRRRKGMSAEEAMLLGNPRAKMVTHLLAESCVKQMRSPYRRIYDEARRYYERREWSNLHQHNAALRKTGKAVLRDLWRAARSDVEVKE